MAGVNFTLLYAAVIKFKIKDLFKNSEFIPVRKMVPSKRMVAES